MKTKTTDQFKKGELTTIKSMKGLIYDQAVFECARFTEPVGLHDEVAAKCAENLST